jgi:5-methylcytosine-specific restriction endonuclease McrA
MKNPKATIRNKSDKIWYQLLLQDNCEVCGARASRVHHFFPKGSYSHLRHNLNNGISLCMGCHFKHHIKSDPTIHQMIIQRRGQDWYDSLLQEAMQRPKTITITQLRETQRQLQEALDNLSH